MGMITVIMVSYFGSLFLCILWFKANFEVLLTTYCTLSHDPCSNLLAPTSNIQFTKILVSVALYTVSMSELCYHDVI